MVLSAEQGILSCYINTYMCIWKAVLPDEEPGTVAIFKTMEDWLEENKSNDEGIAAQYIPGVSKKKSIRV